MKKLVLLLMAGCCLAFGVNAQTRKLRQDEIDFYNKLHASLYGAIPHSYKDWKANGDPQAFDVIKFFCPVVYADNDCTGKCPVSIGKGDPYSLSVTAEFAMPSDQKEQLAGAAMASLTSYTDPVQVATALKSTAKSILTVTVIANVNVSGTQGIRLGYCSKTTPQALQIPVPVTLALLGTHSAQCPYMNGGSPSLSPGEGYYDHAIIFIGKPVVSKTIQQSSDGNIVGMYGIGFDKTRIGVPIVQNIVVEFKGDADDIKEAIKMIDWQKLNSLISK
jgi:hypothetical protein